MVATVLVIEDNPDITKLLVRLLKNAGIQGETVDSAEDGLARLETRQFDAVLMDIRLPRMDGKEATRLIRANPLLKDLPVIAVSAHILGDRRQEILDSGVTALISKPLDPDELLATLRSCVPAIKALETSEKVLQELREKQRVNPGDVLL